jgi:hypothetical protein
MTYVLKNYDGTVLVSIADGTVNTTATSISLPGRNYPQYGEPVVEDLVYMLQNFAAPNQPINPITGQIWYDTTNQIIKVFNGSKWLSTGKTTVSNTLPPTADIGQVLWMPGNRQLFVYDTSGWRLVGPIGAANPAQDPIYTTSPANTTVQAMQIQDAGSTNHSALVFSVSGQVLAIISNDPTYVLGAPGITGFTNIEPGINLNSNALLNGTATHATDADNANNLNGLGSSQFMILNQDNLPPTPVNLGSVTNKYKNMWAETFNGNATSANYADLAERYRTDTLVEPGTVMQIGGIHEVTPTTEKGSTEVLGVVSTKPGLMLNSHAGQDSDYPYIALTGRVPVKVMGPVRKGDRIMSSSESGIAERWNPSYSELSIIGRVLETKLSNECGLVECVVGLR